MVIIKKVPPQIESFAIRCLQLNNIVVNVSAFLIDNMYFRGCSWDLTDRLQMHLRARPALGTHEMNYVNVRMENVEEKLSTLTESTQYVPDLKKDCAGIVQTSWR